MPEVFIDGERVEFSGAVPETVQQMRELLEQALAEQGRVLAGIVVDGVEFSEERGADATAGVQRIDVASLDFAAAMRQLCAGLSETMAAARRETARLGGEVLRAPWIEVQGACISLAETISGALPDLGSVVAHAGEDSAAARAMTHLAPAMERWIDAVQARDAAAASICLDEIVAPALQQAQDALVATMSDPTGSAPKSS